MGSSSCVQGGDRAPEALRPPEAVADRLAVAIPGMVEQPADHARVVRLAGSAGSAGIRGERVEEELRGELAATLGEPMSARYFRSSASPPRSKSGRAARRSPASARSRPRWRTGAPAGRSAATNRTSAIAAGGDSAPRPPPRRRRGWAGACGPGTRRGTDARSPPGWGLGAVYRFGRIRRREPNLFA